jgi:hypothetical protein
MIKEILSYTPCSESEQLGSLVSIPSSSQIAIQLAPIGSIHDLMAASKDELESVGFLSELNEVLRDFEGANPVFKHFMSHQGFK